MATNTAPISYKFTMDLTQLTFFLEKVHDLTAIDNEILLKIDKEKILLYAAVGEKNNINAFKSYIFNTDEIFSFETEIEHEIRFIIVNAKKFETTLKNYLDYQENIKCDFFMNDDTYVDNFKLKNSKLKLSIVGGDCRAVNTNIDMSMIASVLNKDLIDFQFSLDKTSFLKIKKIGDIDNENDILTLNVIDNALTIGENNWNLEICKIEHDELSITFPKKYFKSITFTENEINVYVFDTFILIDNANTTLLISLELIV